MIHIHACMVSIPAGKIVENENKFIIPDFIYLCAMFELCHQFLYAHMTCILAGMISIPMGMFSIPPGALCIPLGMICIPTGIIGNQIPTGDTCW